MDYSYHRENIRFAAGSNAKAIGDAMYADLKTFKNFDKANVATLNIAPLAPGKIYKTAHFKLNENVILALLGIPDQNSIANILDSIDIALVNQDAGRTVMAVTLGLHPLVGVRKFSVATSIDSKTGEVIATITTETWERSRALGNGLPPALNELGKVFGGGRESQKSMWANYLDNIAEYWRFTPPAGLPAGKRDGPGLLGVVHTNSYLYPDGAGNPDLRNDFLNSFRWELPVDLQENDPSLPPLPVHPIIAG